MEDVLQQNSHRLLLRSNMGKGNLSQRCFSAHHTRGSVDKQDETKGKELVEQIEREYASQQEK
jgi:hypothetical protein